jgi:hypothetical protein
MSPLGGLLESNESWERGIASRVIWQVSRETPALRGLELLNKDFTKVYTCISRILVKSQSRKEGKW